MNNPLIILSLAILPALLLMVFIYRQDKTKKEPLELLLKGFLYGTYSVLLVFAIHFCLEILGIDVQRNVFLSAFVSAALIEESAKFYFLKKLIWNDPHFDERFDGIIYAVFVSLGFAVVENLLYLFVYVPEAALETGFQRAIWAVPAHFLFAVIMGYYFSMARFSTERRNYYLTLSLLMAVLAHGMYDVLLMFAEAISNLSPVMSSLTMVGFYIFDILLWKMGLKRIRRLTLADEYNNLKF